MADDIRLSVGFLTHPKTRRLRRRLGADAVLSLIALFAWTATNRYTGDLSGLSDDDIEDVADWDGAAGAFALELASIGWIEGAPGMRRIHDWHEHNPYAATKGKRIARAKAAASARWEGQGKLPLEPPPPAPSQPDALSIESDATSIETDAPSIANPDGEQCPPHHTTPHHSAESSARAREASPDLSEPDQQRLRALVAGLRSAGCPDASDAHPALIAVVASGVDIRALQTLATEKPGKGVNYLLATLRGRLEEARTVPGLAAGAPVRSAAGEGPSPAREPEDPVANAMAYARRMVDVGGMDEATAAEYVAAARAKHEQGIPS